MSSAGRKFEPVRWTIERASQEFGIGRKELTTMLKRGSHLPGEDDRFSTAQIVRAIYNDLESERIRKTRAEADGQEMHNRKMAGELVDVEEFGRRYDPVFIDAKRIVMASGLTDADKDTLLGGLAKILEDAK